MAKLLASCVCVFAGGWGLLFLFHADSETMLKGLAGRVLAGQRFEHLESVAPDLERAEARRPCNPIELRSDAIIRVRLQEEAVAAAEPRQADLALLQLRDAVDRGVQCAPTEGFFWFLRYWTRINQGADAAAHVDDLDMSYRLAPFEGWIAVRRNVYALAVYGLLTEDQRRPVRAEFAALVNSGLLAVAVRNLLGPGWPLRDALVAELDAADLTMRYHFARMLRSEGVDLPIPGITLREPMGWRP